MQPRFLNIEYLFYQIYRLGTGDFSSVFGPDFYFWAWFIWYIFLALSVILLIGIINFSLKLERLIRKENEKIFGKKIDIIPDVETKKNEQWELVVKHVESPSQNDWKLAIIEADKMLEGVINRILPGYENLSIGEKLKKIESSDFLSINEAWEAHKVRNRIAHESAYEITEREAKLVIGMYKKVFEEFSYI